MACNVTVTSSASVKINQFRVDMKSGATIITVRQFSYPATYTNFGQVINDSTYCWATSTVSDTGKSKKAYACLKASGSNVIIKVSDTKDVNASGVSTSVYISSSSWASTSSAIGNRKLYYAGRGGNPGSY